YGEQISYAGLVQEILGITLGKIQTRTDWSQRPLTLEQRQYAADDVYYLGQIYIRLRSDLARRGRLEWLD
ncbi:MAG: ribonuclease D, partial [Phycisphaerae bacterium]|nr:ribonuclease D [Phycisphaerae bacterium]